MRLPDTLRAREPAFAARASAVVLVAAAVVMAWSGFLATGRPGNLGQLGSWALVGILLVAALVCRRVDPEVLDDHGVLLGLPILGAATLSTVNLLTADTSAAAQVFLVMPVLLAATQLRGAGAALVATVSVAGNAVVVGLLEPLVAGLSDIVFVGAALVTVTVVLVQAEDRKERLVDALHALASADGLTGLLQRRVLDDELRAAMAHGETALLLVDIDRFKTINDTHGHLVGDDALVHLAGVLRGELRHTDSVAGRIGGDELAMVLPGCSQEAALVRAEHLVAAVRASPMNLPDGSLLPLTVSVGIAHSPTHADEVRPLYAAADAALYAAKRAGRDGFVGAVS